jgi:hypothetical protein
MFILKLQVIPIPIRLWDLKIGERFALEATGWNAQTERFEIYLKIARAKCLLDSLEDKPVFSIPKIAKGDVGYKVIENWGQP